MDKQGDIITRGMGGKDADYSFKSMIKNYVRIATLNARSILKGSQPSTPKILYQIPQIKTVRFGHNMSSRSYTASTNEGHLLSINIKAKQETGNVF